MFLVEVAFLHRGSGVGVGERLDQVDLALGPPGDALALAARHVQAGQRGHPL